MADNDLSLRDAGNRISSSGLADDVRRPAKERGGQTQRQEARNEPADDADRRIPKRGERESKAPRVEAEAEDDDHDYGDGDTFGGDDDEADGSNQETGDTENGEDGEESDQSEGEEGEDEPEADEATHKVKVDGKEFTVTTSELVAGYQRNADYHRKTQKLAERGRDLTASHAKVAETLGKKLQQVAAVSQGIRNLLIGDVNSQEMNQLRRDNPTAWTVARQELSDRIQKIDNVLNGINAEHERHVAETGKQQLDNLKAVADQQLEILTRHIPDWREVGAKRVMSYLVSPENGFTKAEIENVYDARMLLVAEKARKWDAYQAQRKAPPKAKSKPLPKNIRPGQSQLQKGAQQTTRKAADFRRAKDQAKKTGDMRDAGRAISKLI